MQPMTTQGARYSDLDRKNRQRRQKALLEQQKTSGLLLFGYNKRKHNPSSDFSAMRNALGDRASSEDQELAYSHSIEKTKAKKCNNQTMKFYTHKPVVRDIKTKTNLQKSSVEK